MNLKAKGLHSHRLKHAKTKSVPGTGQLTYFIWEGVLVGIFGGEQIYATAWSGGGGGAKGKKFELNKNTNNPYMYALKAVYKEVQGKGSRRRFLLCEEDRFLPAHGGYTLRGHMRDSRKKCAFWTRNLRFPISGTAF